MIDLARGVHRVRLNRFHILTEVDCRFSQFLEALVLGLSELFVCSSGQRGQLIPYRG